MRGEQGGEHGHDLKREQARIDSEVAQAESQLATDGYRLAQAKQIIDLALDLARDCAASYLKAQARRAQDVEPGILPDDPRSRRAIADFT